METNTDDKVWQAAEAISAADALLVTAGEDFTTFNQAALALLEAAPDLRGDPDLGAINEGVTIIWLK